MFGKTLSRFVARVSASLLRPLTAGAQTRVQDGAVCVETSRYSHATNPGGSRVYFSKPFVAGCGLTASVGTVQGDTHLWVVLHQDGRFLWEGAMHVNAAKSLAATFSSAAVRARPATGNKMTGCDWAGQVEVTADARGKVTEQLSLFA